MNQMANYLTPTEAGVELAMTADGARKLVRSGKLKGVKLSERKIVISRAALEAYRRRLNGEERVRYSPPEVGEPAELRERFEAATGCTPEDWMDLWKNGKLEDSAATMTLMMQASALRAAEFGGSEAARGFVSGAFATH